jgi:type I restriction enzyme, R subunit
MTPEQKARVSIDALLQHAGWNVCGMAHANIDGARGVALREPAQHRLLSRFTSLLR